MKKSASSRQRMTGQSMAEFALVFPLLLLLIFGTIDFGRAIYSYITISNASRMGVRTAIVNQYEPDVRQRAADQATALGIDPLASCTTASSGFCVSFLTSDQTANCSDLYDDDQKSCVAVVTTKYTFRAITPIVGNIIGPIAMTSKSVQALESKCTVTGCPIP
jgi:Flp pilus assembly protein TadG